ncbi:hypothetical protein POJ06DRAFT_274992 [Lipomyces tetrasporus]|uniref:Uncharacterized protein n=1 Tax=Lipomyces tetrasporus TaxID=54092 RepID=A0AAD7VUI1_9ASCO|nr:uncharacterized protein POJ06DRAFT_274992 [Lipomyces tetrasporus]KAJ8101260.1 hypothetical protein POJ06DRAFT_274992 [Lipomyces tetrasporus]
MALLSAGTMADSFDYAFQFVRRRPFDSRLDISLSERDCFRLEAASQLARTTWGNSVCQYAFTICCRFGYMETNRETVSFPRFDYNRLLSRATITTSPSDLNRLLLGDLRYMIRRTTVSCLREHGFPETVWSSVRNAFSGEEARSIKYFGSTKTVDDGLQFDESGARARMLTCAIIGGTMGRGSNIQDDIRLLLYGIKYRWIFSSALTKLRPDYWLEIQRLRNGFADLRRKRPLGPYVYGDFAWVGQVSNFFLEVYKRRGKSEKPEVTRHVIVEEGKCIKQGMVYLNLTISDSDIRSQ